MFVVLFDYFLCKKFNGVSLGEKKTPDWELFL